MVTKNHLNNYFCQYLTEVMNNCVANLFIIMLSYFANKYTAVDE